MPSSSFLTVSFLDASGAWQISRTFATVKASRKWARWLTGQAYCLDVAIHRGGPGGERLAA